jgi:RNA polymerase sigma factor (sigma-70 family)
MMDAPTYDDGHLLTVFAESGDESAFAAIVERHSGQVRSTARRVLGDADEAQDIAQAVFLTLAQKARSLRKDMPLAGWLHRVAWRLALDARKSRERRRNREEQAMQESESPTPPPDDNQLPREELDAALERMPEKYRLPLVLFHLEGYSLSDVAECLGLNPSTVGTRLDRARDLLRRKLVRRGATVGSMASLLALISAEAEVAGFPPALVSATAAAAGLNLTGTTAGGSVAGGGLVSAKVAALTDSALKLLFWGQVKTVAAVCAGVAMLGGAGVTVATLLTHPPQPEARQAAVVAPVAAPVMPALSNVVAAAAYEDGAILFQDSFEEGLGKWRLYTQQGAGDRLETTEKECPDVRLVRVERNGKSVAVAELVGKEPDGPRVGLDQREYGLAEPTAYSLSYEYTYEGRQRLAMEGIDIDRRPTTDPGCLNGTFLKPARPSGEWNQVRWEHVWKLDAEGQWCNEAKLFFNGEFIGQRTDHWQKGNTAPCLMLEVPEGRFRFANVVIREMRQVVR